MNLPFRIGAPHDEPVVSVDGAFDAPGLNLSHWPGNTTPADLKHDLSTGIALNFARLDPEERERRAAGCVEVLNNHYDTDGVCSALAVLQPERALRIQDGLLEAALAGDFFRAPSERGLAIDATVSRLVDAERSPLALAGMTDEQRQNTALADALERVPRMLEHGIESETVLWHDMLEAWRSDTRDLQSAVFDDLVHLDYAVWTGPMGRASSRDGAGTFDPGRHALWGRTEADRVLVLGPTAAGTTCRFLLSTVSWFDLVSRTAHARPDLAKLASQLNALEGTDADASTCWRHESMGGASPELWFGEAHASNYEEHADAWLRPSGLDPLVLKARVTDAVRAAWTFPDDDDDDLSMDDLQLTRGLDS
tara:strand:- start:1669 stop:2766 length:1098 start_codon:yes stop_codon:yes gene_type:complete